MANEILIVSSSENTGWTVYANLFDTAWAGTALALDVAHTVWNGTAFVTDSWAARNLGGIALTETVPGTYRGSIPVGITTFGNYPIEVYHQLGGSKNAQTDTAMIPDGNTVTYAGSGPFVDMTYTPSAQATTVRPSLTYFTGAGIPIRITPDTPTAIALADWEIRIGVATSGGVASVYDSFTVALGNLSGDPVTGIMYVNPTSTQSQNWNRSSLQIEVWNVSTDDKKTVYGVARINLHGTLHP